ncbi:MAG: sugar ABC transporter ATP-binding protein [Spirochaetales bacterium]|nr:sugar ABC transporter ATP-binding protein [Spirochaetales bacterium]
MGELFLEARNISKAYEGVQALDNVGLSLGKGSIHCLVGENGSGKSTLIKIIGGVVTSDAGEIVIDGGHFHHLSAIESIREGIQIIYQDLSLFPNLTVAENISLNQMVERRTQVVDWKEIRAIAERALVELGEEIDLNILVEDLSVARKQVVAIGRALTQNAKLIIMDEPTSAITREEVDHLFEVIHRLKAKGIGTLFVSHKLNEVFEIAETVTVLRDGRKVGDYDASDLTNDKLTFLMTGETIEYHPYTVDSQVVSEPPVLEVRNLTRKDEYTDVSFSVRRGEILGITGLIGSGRTEVALSVCGLNQPHSGEILVESEPVTIGSPRKANQLGISYLPEDRLTQGLFQHQSIGDNTVIAILRRLLSKLGLIDWTEKTRVQDHWVNELAIKTPSAEVSASSLSGGNQQRVVLAKWLATEPKVFFLDGPTIGIDIGSKSNIHEIIRELARKGMAIVMISDEIEEVRNNCNRILIMRKGRIAGEIEDPTSVDDAEIFRQISGKNGSEVPRT